MSKIILTGSIFLVFCLIGLALYANQSKGYFAQVPVEEIHTMRVDEDGSFEIVYKDQGLGETSEVGCLPGGLCND